MANFNVETMFIASRKAIEDFSNQHKNETFYAFSIDADLLCLNSMEKSEETLHSYQKDYPGSYSKQEDIQALKFNTGDWAYQGFFDLDEGFDNESYSEHYHLPIENKIYEGEAFEALLRNTPYHQAMQALMQKILDSNVLDLLNRTSDFKSFLSEHGY